MNATTSTHESVSDDARRIDTDRIHRAMTEDLEIAVVAPQQYAVMHDDTRYGVDLGAGTCECPDATYRDVACKHQIAAATFHAYLEERNPRLVARIVRAVTDHGCAHGVRGCAGPVALGERGIPCEGCIEHGTPGHWAAWNRLVESRVVVPDDLPTAPSALVADMDADAGSQDPELVTDGGQEPDADGTWVLKQFDEDYNVKSRTHYDGIEQVHRVRDAMTHDQRVRSCIVPADGDDADAGSQDPELVADGGQETAPAPGDTIGDLDAANAAAQAGLLLRVQPEAPDPTEYLAIRAGSWAVRKHGQRMWSSLSADEARERVTAALALTERAGGGGVRAADHDDGLTEAERQ